jgi:hypothetical protein
MRQFKERGASDFDTATFSTQFEASHLAPLLLQKKKTSLKHPIWYRYFCIPIWYHSFPNAILKHPSWCHNFRNTFATATCDFLKRKRQV